MLCSYLGCSHSDPWSAFATKTGPGETTVIIINWSDNDELINNVTFSGHSLGIVPGPDETVSVTDLWSNEVIADSLNYEDLKRMAVDRLPPCGSVVYRLKTESKSDVTVEFQSATELIGTTE